MYEIFIDYDNQNIKKFLKEFKNLKELIRNILSIDIKIKKIRKTVNGFHIYCNVEIPKSYNLRKKELFLLLNTLEIILNSDRKRAVFNLLRILIDYENYKNISVLFKDTEIGDFNGNSLRWN